MTLEDIDRTKLGYKSFNAWFHGSEPDGMIRRNCFVITIDDEHLIASQMAELLGLNKAKYLQILEGCGAIPDICDLLVFLKKEQAEAAIITFRLMR
jgi:hypothetical protein